MTTGKPLLAVRNIRLTFGGITAIKDVSFEVEKGEFFAIIGPNGAGKTSMLNVLNGVYKPTSGSVEFDGQSLLGRKPADIARLGIARTFQNLALFEEMTVLDNVVLGRHHFMKAGVLSGMFWFGRARREEYEARRDCMPLLELMGLDDIRDEIVRELPYGVKKRIELARALAMRPKLLLLDEPVAGMNGAETAELASWVLNAKRELDLTIIMIEHDMALVTKVADRVLVLDFGEVICCDKPSVAVNDPRVIRAYLGGTDEKVIEGATAALTEDEKAADGKAEKAASDDKKPESGSDDEKAESASGGEKAESDSGAGSEEKASGSESEGKAADGKAEKAASDDKKPESGSDDEKAESASGGEKAESDSGAGSEEKASGSESEEQAADGKAEKAAADAESDASASDDKKAESGSDGEKAESDSGAGSEEKASGSESEEQAADGKAEKAAADAESDASASDDKKAESVSAATSEDAS